MGGVVVHVVGRALKLALPQGPHRLGVDPADAVNAGAAVGVGPGVVVRVSGLALQVVDVPHAGAGVAGVAIARAYGAQEIAADAGVVEPQGGVDVGDAFTGGVGDAAVDIVGVHAVAPFVIEDTGDLTGVRTATAGAVEIHRGAVPERVAVLVDVHVGGQLLGQPGVRRQLAPAHLLDAIELVEARAGGVGVAGSAEAWGHAIGAAGGAEIEAVGLGQAARAAVVAHAHELPRQAGAHAAAGREVAAGIRRDGAAGGRDVEEGHRPSGLLDAVGHDAVVGHRQDAAFDLGVLVLILVGQHSAVVGVDQDLPIPLVTVHLNVDGPRQLVAIPSTEVVLREGLAGGHGYVDELGLAPLTGHGERVPMILGDPNGLLGGQPGALQVGIGIEVAPLMGAHQRQVTLADDRGDVAVAHRDTTDLAGDPDLNQVAAVVRGDAVLAKLGGGDVERALIGAQICHEGFGGGSLDGSVRLWRNL